MNRLHKYLPSYYEKSKVFGEITKVESDEFNKLDLDIEDLSKQFVVDTATWGLAIYEKELGLPIRPDKTLDERRSIIKAKMRGMGKVDFLMIKAIVEAFTNHEVIIEFDGRINIVFKDSEFIDMSNSDMYHFIDEVKPSHLNYLLENRIIRSVFLKSEYRNGDVYIPPCNTIVAGTWWYQQNEGRVKRSDVKIESKLKDVEFNYPETAQYVVGEDGHIRHDFATQLSLDQTIVIKSIIKSVDFDYKKANELIAGIYPELQNEALLRRSKISVKTNKKIGSFKYRETARYLTGRDDAEYDFATQLTIDQVVFIESKLKATEFDFPETDDLICGSYPNLMKTIKNIRRKFNSNSKAKRVKVDYRLCGTCVTKEGFNG